MLWMIAIFFALVIGLVPFYFFLEWNIYQRLQKRVNNLGCTLEKWENTSEHGFSTQTIPDPHFLDDLGKGVILDGAGALQTIRYKKLYCSTSKGRKFTTKVAIYIIAGFPYRYVFEESTDF
jgi:hypothetical protein